MPIRLVGGGGEGGRARRESEARFAAYVDSLADVLGHADRAGPLMDYCTGLLMPCERKSVEPIASIVAPARATAAHQSLLHFVGQSGWSDEAMLGKVRDLTGAGVCGARRRRSLDRRRDFRRRVRIRSARRGNMRAAGQDRQLSDRGDAIDRQSSRESAPRALSRGSPIGSICRKSGRTTPSVEKRRACSRGRGV